MKHCLICNCLLKDEKEISQGYHANCYDVGTSNYIHKIQNKHEILCEDLIEFSNNFKQMRKKYNKDCVNYL
jgi:hypothetical protein